MFMAFAASLRSADLSRQVGAVITLGSEICSTGANDCPKPGGGLYWPRFLHNQIVDDAGGRDYMRGFDSNDDEKRKLIERITENFPEAQRAAVRKVLRESSIGDLTEYGRVVHAEMEAILGCARQNISCRGGTIYCTTFPCHNCAKHIIAAGIKEVIYVEPYPKSKALEFHPDAVTIKRERGVPSKVRFKPFVGVGPRQFFDLFSMKLSSGKPLQWKDSDGNVFAWKESTAKPRVQMLTVAHREFEKNARMYLKKLKERREPNLEKAKKTGDRK
jgi:deoxycytidylate deaminase